MVEARSSEDLFRSPPAARAASTRASRAVTVTSVDSDTTAVIGSGALINQGVSDGSATQDVNVSARNHARLDAYTGSARAGRGRRGGAAWMSASLRNDTTALIDDSAGSRASRDVDVNALTSAEIDSVVVSARAGSGAIAGGVAVYSIGSGSMPKGAAARDGQRRLLATSTATPTISPPTTA